MPDPQIRKWTIARCPECGEIQNDVAVTGPDCGAPEEGWETVRVVEAAPVIAALDAIAAELALEWLAPVPAEKIMQNVNRALGELRRAVSDE